MPTPFIAGNWKMNTTIQEGEALVQAMLPRLQKVQGVTTVLCPPFTSLFAIGKLLQGTQILLGAQNMHPEPKGAYTGEVSPAMLAGLCRYVILGHSERRHIFGETDEFINKKVKAALEYGLTPILCVGERLEENRSGRTEQVITRQVEGGLANIPQPKELVVAYEPVWAIGTGVAATAEEAQKTIELIRRIVSRLYGIYARGVPILYGGSVTPDNIAQFISQPDIDGALVGGASLNADGFAKIVETSARVKG